MADDGSAFNAIESLLGDRYTREARLAPAFLCFFPVLLVLLALFVNPKAAIGRDRSEERFTEFLFQGQERATVENWYLEKARQRLPNEADELKAENTPQGLDELYECGR